MINFKKFKSYFYITVISIIFSIYLFEGYLTYKNEKNTNYDLNKIKNIYYEQTGKRYDDRSKLEIYNDLIKTNKNVSVNIPVLTKLELKNELFPLSGISNSNTIVNNENGYFMNYMSDRYGFNNPDEEWDKKIIDYVLLGDSFVHGYSVNRPDDIGSNLRKLSDNGVLNLGYGGNGPLAELASLKEYIKKNTKKILWLYYEGNDLIDLHKELKSEILKNYIEKKNFNQNLINRQKEIDKLNKNLIKYSLNENAQFEKSILSHTKKNKEIKYKFLKFIRLDKFKKNFLIKKKTQLNKTDLFIKLDKILEIAKEIAIINNAEIYFIYLKDLNSYRMSKTISDLERVKSIVVSNNIKFIDLHEEIFSKEKNFFELLPFSSPGNEYQSFHFNEKGYKKIANKIKKLTSN